mmetsp:Transcript_43521/g.70628  ORF Transcript_43521/g.70628 Transcript_43521/m.70628 type:complete len:485 (+) Transcript_43521:248-1702(+)|eukprot:CAMPEP_0184654670 /NCGR_PEP_ID=MMETSP0308-20130426/12332_1 /TAXON_ID=38269 /ORGANISM="Gloeochaete witrockiana, Strain SAG 46.84" /LENGTH=484 /DNA_ID=CAMNT_0027090765 /DNA_START=215 /DNA_END=1669 /DNA_ORIENTATION=+
MTEKGRAPERIQKCIRAVRGDLKKIRRTALMIAPLASQQSARILDQLTLNVDVSKRHVAQLNDIHAINGDYCILIQGYKSSQSEANERIRQLEASLALEKQKVASLKSQLQHDRPKADQDMEDALSGHIDYSRDGSVDDELSIVPVTRVPHGLSVLDESTLILPRLDSPPLPPLCHLSPSHSPTDITQSLPRPFIPILHSPADMQSVLPGLLPHPLVDMLLSTPHETLLVRCNPSLSALPPMAVHNDSLDLCEPILAPSSTPYSSSGPKSGSIVDPLRFTNFICPAPRTPTILQPILPYSGPETPRPSSFSSSPVRHHAPLNLWRQQGSVGNGVIETSSSELMPLYQRLQAACKTSSEGGDSLMPVPSMSGGMISPADTWKHIRDQMQGGGMLLKRRPFIQDTRHGASEIIDLSKPVLVKRKEETGQYPFCNDRGLVSFIIDDKDVNKPGEVASTVRVYSAAESYERRGGAGTKCPDDELRLLL